jgi:hypothetical protein
MNGLVRKLAAKIGLSFLLGQIRAAAEGRLGKTDAAKERWKTWYWRLVGAKTYTGLALAVACAVSLALGYDQSATVIGTVGAFLVSIGLIDRSWRTDLPAWLSGSATYRFLANNATSLTLLVGALYSMFLTSTEPWAATAQTITLGVGAALVQIGLMDSAWSKPAPEKPADPPKK